MRLCVFVWAEPSPKDGGQRTLATNAPYDFDRRLFGIDEMADEEIDRHASEVAQSVLASLIA